MILHNLTFIFQASPLHDPVHIWFSRRVYIPLRRPFIPSSTSSGAEEEEERGVKGAPADDQKAGLGGFRGWGAVGGKERGAGEKRKKVAKGIKMKTIHLSRSVWQPQAPFDNVMHTIIHAQCGGHWETLVGGGRKKKHLLLCLPDWRH